MAGWAKRRARRVSGLAQIREQTEIVYGITYNHSNYESKRYTPIMPSWGNSLILSR